MIETSEARSSLFNDSLVERRDSKRRPRKPILLPPRMVVRTVTAAVLLLVCLLSPSFAADVVRSDSPSDSETQKTDPPNEKSQDFIEDSIFDPLQADPDCMADAVDCWSPPESTIEEQEIVVIDDSQKQQPLIYATCSYGGDDPDEAREGSLDADGDSREKACKVQDPLLKKKTITVDKHWGSDPTILRTREKLRLSGTGASRKNEEKQKTKDDYAENKRPPIFLMPGLASTRLVAWRYKACPHVLSDIKVQDCVWLNMNLIMQMGTIDVSCMQECLQLGLNQSDTDDRENGCKLRPDEGLDAISSLSPGNIGSQLLGGTNTVYAWLVQWLADNLGYDVSNIIGLPYDWRMSPDKTEERDGFLTLTRRRIEAAVQSNGQPGVMVAHSMGNTIFRYFLEWLRTRLREEAYDRYIKQAERRAKAIRKATAGNLENAADSSPYLPGWMSRAVPDFDEWFASTYSDIKKTVNPEKHKQLWELALTEGDDSWIDWIREHIYTYVGLSAPMLGAVNPLRAVISGENMGMPVNDEAARRMEVTFGSTHTVNPISSKEGFCDQWDAERWDEEPVSTSKSERHADARLACLDDLYVEIEYSSDHKVRDPWENFPSLRALMKERRDWDSDFPMIEVVKEMCEEKEKTPCAVNSTLSYGPKDVQTGDVFTRFSEIWKEKEDPLVTKREQLRESFWDTKVTNILNRTWERPLIKHVIMAYGVDIQTEVGYAYRKTERVNKKNDTDDYSGLPNLRRVLWEMPGGRLEDEQLETGRGGITDLLKKKKPKRANKRQGNLQHSGDGSIPYLSLSWAHTWLLHAVRALRHSGKTDGPTNPLDSIAISHRPKGAMEWEDGPPPQRVEVIEDNKKVEESTDTGTAHPHGTKYKPEMVRYHNRGTSRTTGIEYTTTVIEAIGVEHKETTRNYDILAAVFTDVLRFMYHDESNEDL